MAWSKEELGELLDGLKKQYGPDELVKALGLEGLVSERSCLSDTAILRSIEQGKVVIDPFRRENLATSSYDVSLGQYFYRELKPNHVDRRVLNPYDERHVRKIWQLHEAQTLRTEAKEAPWSDAFGENISPEDRVILIGPGETILAHTDEYIGGRADVTTMMKARSSMGRNFIAVCKCAGWGDVGYINRWTMEITNVSQYYMIPLVVGRRIAQIVFFGVEPIQKKDYSGAGGKYQTSEYLDELKAKWSPDSMLPKMWKDREVRKV